MSQIIPIYIPTYINNAEYSPARVLPRLLFYNGLLDCQSYYIESASVLFGGVTYEQTAFPYFDNYNVVTGSFPTVNSKSLLFNNEEAAYGEIPTGSLYTNYWEKYISFLYNPKTRLLNCAAIIPLAEYFNMELNDIVNFKGNYYHLRAINDYSLKTGECNLQLLGPIITDTFTAAYENSPTSSRTTTTTSTTTTIAPPSTTTTTFSNNPCNCVEVTITSNGGEVATFNCYGVNENYVYINAGTYYLCAAVIGGLLQADIVSGTGTVTPIGNCKTGACPPISTTTTAGPTTTTTTSTTTIAPTTTTTTLAINPLLCYTLQVVNTFGGPINDFQYVSCGENFSRSVDLPALSTSSFCIQGDKYERSTGATVTLLGGCTTTTLSPTECITWILQPGSPNVWYGNYVNCYGTVISGSYVDSNQFICAIGTPQYISGGGLVPSGSCTTTTTTSTTTTTLAPGCYTYEVINPSIGVYNNWMYVQCGENFSRSVDLGGYSTSSFCIQDAKYEIAAPLIITNKGMCTTTTLAPGSCNTWILDPGSSELWYGNYLNCYGSAISGAYLDSNQILCAVGTPQRISGGFINPSGSCATTTTTSTTTTTLAPGCYLYSLYLPSGLSVEFDYVPCATTSSASIGIAAGETYNVCIEYDKYERGTDVVVTNLGQCTTTTIAPGSCQTWVLSSGSTNLWYGNYLNCYNQAISGTFVDSNEFICAIGVPQRISGGNLVSSGSCTTTTTTSTTTTTLAPGCFIYDVQNSGTGTGFVNYVYCGNGSTYQQFFLAGGASGSICVDNDQINAGGNLNMSWNRTTASCAATTTTTTTTTAAPTTTTTTLAPGCFIYTINNLGTGTGFVNYVYCGNGSTYEQFFVAGGGTGSVCVDNDQINSGGNINMIATRTTASCAATTTTTAGPTTTTTTTTAAPTTTTTSTTTTTTTTAAPTTTTTTTLASQKYLLTSCLGPGDIIGVFTILNAPLLSPGDGIRIAGGGIAGYYCFQVNNTSTGTSLGTYSITDVYPGVPCDDCSE